jgi:hypothetical protein
MSWVKSKLILLFQGTVLTLVYLHLPGPQHQCHGVGSSLCLHIIDKTKAWRWDPTAHFQRSWA